PAMDRDLLKTQSESHPGNPQSKRQKTKIIRQAHQQTVLRSLQLIQELKTRGYRVFCIDREHVNGSGTVWNHIPFGAEDKTGALPLSERARWIKYAEFFIGLSSGLSWLAWCVGTTPVVLISGFTRPENEFSTPYRVINWHACNGCSNDIRCVLDTSNYLWCPRHEGTPRQFECSKLIAPEQVMDIIKTIPNLLEDTP
ncbi:autotransporter strand-loop-strand O-heptosyltransferase, partial [Gluconobacter sp. NFX36]|uniref:autotransporter strand-loop-strand O-heptosyltransferase n=1 Tax=Gluconobacter sp. NFX36 TaxID=2819535 RepID=UPI003CF9D818